MRRARILIVEDDKLTRWSLQQKLSREGHEPSCATSGEEGLYQLEQKGADVVLLDLRLPGLGGLDLLQQMRRVDSEVPIIIVTAYSTIESAVQAIKEGAYDYLPKPIDFGMLLVKIEKALETASLKKYVRRLRTQRRGQYTFEHVIAESPKMKQAVALARKVTQSRAVTVLLQGETGTGKDLLARVIHFEGPRRDEPFLEITCTTVPESLLEAELFGYEKGAFTDAYAAKEGLFELADGGTVFLNEIGDLSLNLQAKLLNVIEQKSFRRVGGTKTIEIDVQIIAATNKDLWQAVQERRFREDLYYRLQVFPIYLPPLRERKEDLMPLAHLFLAQFNEECHKNIRGFTESFEECAYYCTWPGNVRELRNLVERAVILLDDGDLISPNLLPATPPKGEEIRPQGPLLHIPEGGIALEEVEKELIRQALEKTQWNQTEAARLLHIGRDALRYRMKKYGYLT